MAFRTGQQRSRRACLKCLMVMSPFAQKLGCDDWLLAGQPREAVEYCVPATGAKVTLASAKQLIFHFCTRLPSDRLVWQMHFHQALWSCSAHGHGLQTQSYVVYADMRRCGHGL